ncbi:MAG TPA: DUF2975 domain-containing protein [Arachidicoccus sp.]
MNKKKDAILYTILVIIVYLVVSAIFFNSEIPSSQISYTTELVSNKQIEYLDSLNNSVEEKKLEYEGLANETNRKIYSFTSFSGFFSLGLGIVNSRYIGSEHSIPNIDKAKQFISLNYIGISNKKVDYTYAQYLFYVKNDTGYISKLSALSKQGSNRRIYSYGNFRKVRYLYSAKENTINGILLPISNNIEKFIIRFFVYAAGGLCICLILFIIISTIAILLSISHNKPFSDLNLFRLKWSYIGCFFLVLYPYLSTLIFYLIYFKDLYPEVSFTHSFWDNDYKWGIAGIVYLLLFLAFRKGYKLQQEQDLTI